MKSFEKYDVIVAGGGPAGCMAAIASARNGMKTLLVEDTTALGGMSTVGLVSTMAPLTDCENIIYDSLTVELMKRYKKRAGIEDKIWDWIPLSPEDLKIVYDEMMEESGAEVLYQSIVCDCLVCLGKIKNITVANKEGIKYYEAKVFIDCTGDGDLAKFSGVPFDIGEDGEI